jgi:hypothetical protein
MFTQGTSGCSNSRRVLQVIRVQRHHFCSFNDLNPLNLENR